MRVAIAGIIVISLLSEWSKPNAPDALRIGPLWKLAQQSLDAFAYDAASSHHQPEGNELTRPTARSVQRDPRSRRLIALVVFAISLVVAPRATEAQDAGKVYRIGLLGTHSAQAQRSGVEALRAGLRDLGYGEGKNMAIEYRWAEGKYDRLPNLVAELVALKVDVIVTTGGTPSALAAKRGTTTIPIVTTGVGDAVGVGLVTSLARPGGNVTGLTDVVPELHAKRLELLLEAVPRGGRVAVLANPVPRVASTRSWSPRTRF